MNTKGIEKKRYFSDNFEMHPVHLIVRSTTGGQFQLSVSSRESVAGLKSTLAKKLKLRAERMNLLHRDRVLAHGTLRDNHLCNGSQLTLVPNMETGTASVSTDSRVMQALENLSESQVNDFLTGRAPLFLAMKLGEHMMFVQLQLSASSCNARRRHPQPPAHSCQPSSNAISSEKLGCSCGQGPHGGSSGAVIDSVNHLGHGVYSGTFSGTLDPSIQDCMGKPKRDINTILQILNDLLMASPQFRQSSHMCQSYGKCNKAEKSLTSSGSGDLHTAATYMSSENAENSLLRGKVQNLQRMMQERRLRRQGKRCLRGPYHWPSRRSFVSQSNFKPSPVNFDSAHSRDREIGAKSESLVPANDASFPTASTTLEHESVLV